MAVTNGDNKKEKHKREREKVCVLFPSNKAQGKFQSLKGR